jgi:hypothetical protein
VTTAKQPWSAEALEAALAAQGIAIAPGRAERLARAQTSLLGAATADPLCSSLEFDADVPGFVAAMEKCE